jgi:hypothetical protein
MTVVRTSNVHDSARFWTAPVIGRFCILLACSQSAGRRRAAKAEGPAHSKTLSRPPNVHECHHHQPFAGAGAGSSRLSRGGIGTGSVCDGMAGYSGRAMSATRSAMFTGLPVRKA